MKKVIFDKETDTINASDCHENDGKIYVGFIDKLPHLLMNKYDNSGYIWIELTKLPKCAYYGGFGKYKFTDALERNDIINLTQLNNLSELGKWLIELNK